MIQHLTNYPKLNTFLKIVLYWIVFLGLFMGISLFYPLVPMHAGMRHGITGSLVAVGVTWLFLKMEKKDFSDIGLIWEAKTILRFIRGLLIGGIIFFLLIGCLLAVTDLAIIKTDTRVGYPMLMSCLALIPLAFMEEVAFRSYPLVVLDKDFGMWISQMIVAIAFALYHLANGWSVYISFTGPFVWAFVFGLAAIWSRGIAMPTGIHTAKTFCRPFWEQKVIQDPFG